MVYLSLGSNLGDRLRNIRYGIDRIRELATGCRARVSSIHETEAWGRTDQPDFLNCAMDLESRSKPAELLDALKGIEKAAGRTGSDERWKARVLDLDILLFGDERIASAELTIPHPLMTKRRFVLVPLAEIAGDTIIPGLDVTVAQALNRCADRGTVRLYRAG